MKKKDIEALQRENEYLRRELEERRRRTPMIRIERQLWPQPPRFATPHWCYSNTLIFYENGCDEVWRQDIPEAGIYLPQFSKAFSCKVERDPQFGWILIYEATHHIARRMISASLFRVRRYAKRRIEKHHEAMAKLEARAVTRGGHE